MANIFLFLFLVLFPFGQIIRIGILKPVDVVIGMAALYTILFKLPNPKVFNHIKSFLVFAICSWLFSIFLFPQVEVLYGFLYLSRLCAYCYFVVYVWNFVKTDTKRKLVVSCLLAVSVISACLGWVQFLKFPDIRPLFVFGWDDHLYRLVGTFLDPTFLGLIIVFGSFVAILRFFEKKQITYFLLTIFLLVSLAFTYSRASYLAFFAGATIIAYHKKLFTKLVILICTFFGIILLLPTSHNHVLSFTRQFSALARVENYKTTLAIFVKSPVFGVGYDNMCIAYQKFIGPQSFASHACSGSDSSLLFILTTTGVVGFMLFVFAILKIRNSVLHSRYYMLLSSSFTALMIHSLFSNSMFYPWIMGWIIILLASAL